MFFGSRSAERRGEFAGMDADWNDYESTGKYDEAPTARVLMKRRMRMFALLRGLLTFDAVGRLRSPRAPTKKGGVSLESRHSAQDIAFDQAQTVAGFFENEGFAAKKRKEWKGS